MTVRTIAGCQYRRSGALWGVLLWVTAVRERVDGRSLDLWVVIADAVPAQVILWPGSENSADQSTIAASSAGQLADIQRHSWALF